MSNLLQSPLELIPLCTVELTIADPLLVGEGPSGNRLVAEIVGFDVAGERLKARLKGNCAADWVVVCGSTATIDVRLTLETQDGAIIYVQYQGRSDVSHGIGSAPFYVAPRFETSHPKYHWLNTVQAAGKGSLRDRRYEWYELR